MVKSLRRPGLVLVILCLLAALFPPGALAGGQPGWEWKNPLPQGNTLYDIVYGAGRFVAVGQDGALITSADGLTWTLGDAGATEDLVAVTYGDALFVATGENGLVLTSVDGLSWARQERATAERLNSVAFAGGRYVAVGGAGSIVTSTDGIHWEAVPLSRDGLTWTAGLGTRAESASGTMQTPHLSW